MSLLGEAIIFDEGHDGMVLKDFHVLAVERCPSLTLVEVCVLRMYTADFFRPWNAALRGLDADNHPDDGKGLERWATCLAVLFSAVIKLSGALPRDPATGKPVTVKRVWRGVGEERMKLPQSFLEATEENQGYPGGAEKAFSSTTTDIFTAYVYSGGWEVRCSASLCT